MYYIVVQYGEGMNNKMDYAEYYYNQVVGYYPFETDWQKEKTSKTIQYLCDAGIHESDILRIIEEADVRDYLKPNNLPDWLWDDSLLKRDTFYFHNTLHIRPPAPIFSFKNKVVTLKPFYLEMKIRYTLEDLASYFYDTIRMPRDLADKKKDQGSFLYLLGKYGKLNFIESIDFVLALIDACREESIQNILDITQVQVDIYKELQTKTANAELAGANRIIWR